MGLVEQSLGADVFRGEIDAPEYFHARPSLRLRRRPIASPSLPRRADSLGRLARPYVVHMTTAVRFAPCGSARPAWGGFSRRPRTLFSIHNSPYQGAFRPEGLVAVVFREARDEPS